MGIANIFKRSRHELENECIRLNAAVESLVVQKQLLEKSLEVANETIGSLTKALSESRVSSVEQHNNLQKAAGLLASLEADGDEEETDPSKGPVKAGSYITGLMRRIDEVYGSGISVEEIIQRQHGMTVEEFIKKREQGEQGTKPDA